MSSAALSVAGVTATAPARVPVPKRARETDDEYDGRSCGGGDYNNSRPLPLTPRANRRAPDLTLDKQQAPCTPVRGQQQQQQPRDGGSAARVSKKAKLEDRIKAEERFRYKYSKAFPGFKFYFDSLDPAIKSSFSQRVTALGAVRDSLVVEFLGVPNAVPVCNISVSSASKISFPTPSPTSSRTRPFRRLRKSLCWKIKKMLLAPRIYQGLHLNRATNPP